MVCNNIRVGWEGEGLLHLARQISSMRFSLSEY